MRSTDQIKIEIANRNFAESVESVNAWIRTDEMAFVLIDPSGWKNVIYPKTLAPLLRRRNVEMLINVMWNYINLAGGHQSQQGNLRDLAGDEYQKLVAEGNDGGGEGFMRAYFQTLKTESHGNGSDRPRIVSFPVEFPYQERVYYYLAYVTHHVKGVIVFLEESERALKYQKVTKFVAGQMRREAETGISDIFGDAITLPKESTYSSEWEARNKWLELLPKANDELRVNEAVIASMAEDCGCLISRLQAALKRLIEEGMLKNLNAAKVRPKNVVNYHDGETIRRLK